MSDIDSYFDDLLEYQTLDLESSLEGKKKERKIPGKHKPLPPPPTFDLGMSNFLEEDDNKEVVEEMDDMSSITRDLPPIPSNVHKQPENAIDEEIAFNEPMMVGLNENPEDPGFEIEIGYAEPTPEISLLDTIQSEDLTSTLLELQEQEQERKEDEEKHIPAAACEYVIDGKHRDNSQERPTKKLPPIPKKFQQQVAINKLFSKKPLIETETEIEKSRLPPPPILLSKLPSGPIPLGRNDEHLDVLVNHFQLMVRKNEDDDVEKDVDNIMVFSRYGPVLVGDLGDILEKGVFSENSNVVERKIVDDGSRFDLSNPRPLDGKSIWMEKKEFISHGGTSTYVEDADEIKFFENGPISMNDLKKTFLSYPKPNEDETPPPGSFSLMGDEFEETNKSILMDYFDGPMPVDPEYGLFSCIMSKEDYAETDAILNDVMRFYDFVWSIGRELRMKSFPCEIDLYLQMEGLEEYKFEFDRSYAQIQSACVHEDHLSVLFGKSGYLTDGNGDIFLQKGRFVFIEVCKGQRGKILDLIKTKIEIGEIVSVTLQEAEKLIVESQFTYEEISTFAKSGKFGFINCIYKENLEKVVTIIECDIGLGISCSVLLGLSLLTGRGIIQSVFDAALVVASMTEKSTISDISIIGDVLTSKKLHLEVTEEMLQNVGSNQAANIVNFFRGIQGDKSVYGKVALTILSKNTQSVITAIGKAGTIISVTIGAFLFAFDVGKTIFGKQSVQQLGINTVAGVGGFVVGGVGTTVGGVIGGSVLGVLTGGAGAAVGAVAGGIVGGTIGGLVGSVGAKGTTNIFVKDDKTVKNKFNEVVQESCSILGLKYWISSEREILYLRKEVPKTVKKKVEIRILRKYWNNLKKDFTDLPTVSDYAIELVEPVFKRLFKMKKTIGPTELQKYFFVLMENTYRCKKEIMEKSTY